MCASKPGLKRYARFCEGNMRMLVFVGLVGFVVNGRDRHSLDEIREVWSLKSLSAHQ